MLNIKTAQELKDSITPERVLAGVKLLIAKAKAGTINPIVKAYQKKILSKHNFKYASKWKHENESIIIDPNQAYLMSDKDAKIYFSECEAEKKAAGFSYLPDGYCPLLVAEHEAVKARRSLFDIFEPVTGISRKNLFKLADIKKYETLLLQMLAPIIKSL